MNTTKPKSSKITAGSIDTEHVSLNLLRANDFVAQKIREQLKDILVINSIFVKSSRWTCNKSCSSYLVNNSAELILLNIITL